MKETRMPPAYAANLVVNSGNAIYGVEWIVSGRTPDEIIFTSKFHTRERGIDEHSGMYTDQHHWIHSDVS